MMADGLGYRGTPRTAATWERASPRWLARAHPDAVAGIHLATPGLPAPPLPWTPAEQAYVAEAEAWTAEEGGYAHQQATKPADPGRGPARLAGRPRRLDRREDRRLEQHHRRRAAGVRPGPAAGHADPVLGHRDHRVLAAALLGGAPYARQRAASRPPAPVPTAVSVFGGERVPLPKPPRELAERYFTLTGWQEHDRGGPLPRRRRASLLAQTLRDIFRPVRGSR